MAPYQPAMNPLSGAVICPALAPLSPRLSIRREWQRICERLGTSVTQWVVLDQQYQHHIRNSGSQALISPAKPESEPGDSDPCGRLSGYNEEDHPGGSSRSAKCPLTWLFCISELIQRNQSDVPTRKCLTWQCSAYHGHPAPGTVDVPIHVPGRWLPDKERSHES